jgi:hypothetical protein
MFRLSKDWIALKISITINLHGGSRMEQKTFWKKIVLLTFAAVMAMHLQVSEANDSTKTGTATSSDEDCIMKDGE